jgi:hypothetical protein
MPINESDVPSAEQFDVDEATPVGNGAASTAQFAPTVWEPAPSETGDEWVPSRLPVLTARPMLVPPHDVVPAREHHRKPWFARPILLVPSIVLLAAFAVTAAFRATEKPPEPSGTHGIQTGVPADVAVGGDGIPAEEYGASGSPAREDATTSQDLIDEVEGQSAAGVPAGERGPTSPGGLDSGSAAQAPSSNENSTTTSSSSGSSSEPGPANGWTRVSSLSGSGEQMGPVFELTGAEARLRYSLQGSGSNLAIWIVPEGRTPGDEGVVHEVAADGSTQQEVLIQKAPGHYYLFVKSTSGTWSAEIVENR